MDEQERAYFRQTVIDLERSKRRWQLIAMSLLAAFALFLVVGMGSVVMFGLSTERLRAREAMMRAEEARAQAQVAVAQAANAEAEVKRLKEVEDRTKVGKPAEKHDKQKAGEEKVGPGRKSGS